MLPLGPAIVSVMDPPMTRTAALVYRTPRGLGWLEPGYFDADPPPSPQWHAFEGQVIDTSNGVMLQGAEQTILILDADKVKGTELDDPAVQRDIEALRKRLAELGTTLDEQRLLLASLVGASG